MVVGTQDHIACFDMYVYTVSVEKMCEGHAIADASAEMSQMGRCVRVVPLFIGYTGVVIVF